MRLAAIALVVATTSAAGVGQAQQVERDASAELDPDAYETLLTRLKGGDTTINFAALRFAFAASPGYSPLGNEPTEDVHAMFAALEEEEFQRALERARRALDEFYLSGDVHLIAAFAHDALENPEQAQFHRSVARGLYDSICAGADGRSKESPCRVISVDEEYFVLRATGLELVTQSLTTCAYGSCDQMEVRDPDSGDEYSMYFDVSTKMNAMSKQLGND